MTRYRPTNSIRLIDLPRPCEGQLYAHTIDKVVTALSSHSFVNSVYQVGGVHHPGISDIDLLVVVDDDATSHADPLGSLTGDERYLFTHSCFLIPVSLALELADYALMHGYRRLHGTSWQWENGSSNSTTASALRVQTALEFLIKNLLDLYVQLEYRTVKVRVLLQHVKGLRLDLELLDLRDDSLATVVEQAVALIDDWFQLADAERAVTELVRDLMPALRRVVADALGRDVLYSPAESTIAFGPNMRIDSAPHLELSRSGLLLPRIPGVAERRSFNAQHRVNRFLFRLPMTKASSGSYQESRFSFLARAKSFASNRFPAYSAPVPPLFYQEL